MNDLQTKLQNIEWSAHWHKIPVWELLVVGIAGFVFLIIFILWLFFGYNLNAIPKTPPTMNAIQLMQVFM